MISVDRALLRGLYAATVAMMEFIGIPVDMMLFAILMSRWEDLRERLAARARLRFPRTFEGTSFSEDGFAWYLRRRGYWWPTLPGGRLALDSDTFDEMIEWYPEFRFLRDTRWMLRQTGRTKLANAIGKDGRNRSGLKPFSTKTGRNAPSTSSFLLAAPAFMRSLIQASPGWALVYADFRQQEYAIMALLSKCRAMIDAYVAGDPYFAFAKAAGAVPRDAVRSTYEEIREIYKTASLAVGYGQGAVSLGHRLRVSVDRADELLSQHRRAYPEYWRWSERVFVTMQMTRRMHAELGWSMWLSSLTENELSIKNWPVQSLGGEILRAACVLAFQRGLRVSAPLYDALLVECRIEDLAAVETQVIAVMEDAGAMLLGGFRLGVDVKSYVHPDHFYDKRGVATWNEIRDLLGLE